MPLFILTIIEVACGQSGKSCPKVANSNSPNAMISPVVVTHGKNGPWHVELRHLPVAAAQSEERPSFRADVPEWTLPEGPFLKDVPKLPGFWTPSTLSHMEFTVLNPRNLSYYVSFWANLPSHFLRTSHMNGP